MCAAGIAVALASPAVGRAPVIVTAPSDVVVRHVPYGDLNLASAPGQARLNHRVSAAVSDVCLDATGGNDGSSTFRFNMKRCSRAAWNDAQPQIDRAILRAQQIAATGSSSIAAAAITFSVPQ